MKQVWQRIVLWFKKLFNIPTYFYTCDPATKGGDYTCWMECKYYPKTGITKIDKIKSYEETP